MAAAAAARIDDCEFISSIAVSDGADETSTARPNECVVAVLVDVCTSICAAAPDAGPAGAVNKTRLESCEMLLLAISSSVASTTLSRLKSYGFVIVAVAV